MLTIRPVRQEEWPVYREVRLCALRDSPDAFGAVFEVEAKKPDEFWSSRIAAACASGKDQVLFAINDEQVCGLVWCKLSATEPGLAEVFQMWVSPDFRGLKIGSALLRQVIAYARAANIKTLRLGVTAVESPAMGLYRSFGFMPVGELSPLREGSSILSQNMVLDLDDV